MITDDIILFFEQYIKNNKILLNKNIMPNSKRSQIAPFIIIGVVLLGSIIIFLLLNGRGMIENIGSNSYVPSDVSPVYNEMQDCINKTLIEGIDYVSKKGGYFSTPDKAIDMEIAYYIYKNINYMPQKEQIENEIEKYMNNEIGFCLYDSQISSEFLINESLNASSKVTIEDEKVSIKIKHPLSISKNNRTYVIEDFSGITKVRLGVLYNVAKQIIDEQMTNKEGICIGCLYELGQKNNVIIKTVDYNEDMIYTITDENSKINDGVLSLNFVNKYGL